jgi:hypothetical protein
VLKQRLKLAIERDNTTSVFKLLQASIHLALKAFSSKFIAQLGFINLSVCSRVEEQLLILKKH